MNSHDARNLSSIVMVGSHSVHRCTRIGGKSRAKRLIRVVAMVILATLAARAAVPSASATVLIFEPDSPASDLFDNDDPVPQGYGDRVTAPAQDGFAYGTGGGATPNVVVDYATGGSNPLRIWDDGYGDLHDVIWIDNPVFGGYGETTLTADAGYVVALHSFDMASYVDSVDETISSLTIRNGEDELLYSASNMPIEGDPNGHTPFVFNPAIAAPVLKIRLTPGIAGENVGIDNIDFSQQSVPEPAAIVLAALALALLAGGTRWGFGAGAKWRA
jgi:hypothetical protein